MTAVEDHQKMNPEDTNTLVKIWQRCTKKECVDINVASRLAVVQKLVKFNKRLKAETLVIELISIGREYKA